MLDNLIGAPPRKALWLVCAGRGADTKKVRKSERGKISVVRCTGFEPVTDCLEGWRSIPMS